MNTHTSHIVRITADIGSITVMNREQAVRYKMTSFRMFLTAMVFALIGCQDAPRSAGGGGIDVPGVETAFCGSTEDTLVFVVLPTFDWINGGGISAGSGSGSWVDQNGAHWWGFRQDEKNHRWDWEVGDGSARFGQQEFALADGEVFIMHRDFHIVQLPHSEAGSRADETNLKRLGDVFKQAISEQDGAGQPATRSESKSEGSQKTQPESERRSR